MTDNIKLRSCLVALKALLSRDPCAHANTAIQMIDAALAAAPEPQGSKCPDGILPDGPTCPRCGEKRTPSGIDGGSWVHSPAAPEPQGVPEPAELKGCACRWDKEDNRVQTCERHQGWLDVVHEWAERAKAAEQALAAHPQQSGAAQPEQERKPLSALVHSALNRAFVMGQNYWADADSESYKANKRSDVTRQKFNAMRDEVCEQVGSFGITRKESP